MLADFLLFLVSVGTFVGYTRHVMPWNEHRPDLVMLADPLIHRFPVYNTWVPVNAIQHVCHAKFLIDLLWWQTEDFRLFALTLITLVWFRSLMIWACPLRAPPNAQTLYDISHVVFMRNIKTFENDLFLSGHVSTCFAIGMVSSTHSEMYFIACVLIAGLMMFSKVHYTIDLMVAPFVAFGSYYMARWGRSVLF